MASVPPLSSPDALLGQLVGEYRLEALLGRGAFGAVYLGQHSSLPSLRVAVKVAHRALAGDQDVGRRLGGRCGIGVGLRTVLEFAAEPV